MFKLDVAGKVPVPSIKPGDRLLLPVDEGIAINAEKEYASGEFDCNSIGSSYYSRNGTMSMIIIERESKYLLIALDNGINSEYKAERKNGLYTLEIMCHKKCGVTYGIFNSLVDACKCYRNIKKCEFTTLCEKIKKIRKRRSWLAEEFSGYGTITMMRLCIQTKIQIFLLL